MIGLRCVFSSHIRLAFHSPTTVIVLSWSGSVRVRAQYTAMFIATFCPPSDLDVFTPSVYTHDYMLLGTQEPVC